jgi:hypothetical protein
MAGAPRPLMLLLLATGCDATASGIAEATGPWSWNADAIEISCASPRDGSMRFHASHDELSPLQLALLANLQLEHPRANCATEVMSCTLTVIRGERRVDYHADEMDGACGEAQVVIPYYQFEGLRETLGCRYSKEPSADPLEADRRCFHGLGPARLADPTPLALRVVEPVDATIELDGCDGSVTGHVTAQLRDSGWSWVVSAASRSTATGPDRTCVSLPRRLADPGDYFLTLTLDPGVTAKADVYLRFHAATTER